MANIPAIRFKGFTDPWEQRKCSDMFKITRGYVLPTSITTAIPDDENKYPVFSSQTANSGLMGYYKDYLYEDAVTWTTDGANAGTVRFRPGKFYCTNVCGVLLTNKIKASKMAAEALNNVAKNYVSYVGNPKLMNNVMADISIAIPQDQDEQNIISAFFINLDNLITLHQRKYEKLSVLKKSLLEKMFPREGENRPEVRFKGFTDPWEQRKLGNVTTILGGNAWSSSDYSEDGSYLIVTIANVTGEQYIDDTIGNRITTDHPREYKLSKDDILVSLTGNVGRVSRMTSVNALLNQRVGKLTISRNVSDNFIFQTLRASRFIDTMQKAGQGAAQQNISNSDVLNYEFNSPQSKQEQELVGTLFDRLDSLITLHQRKLEKLKQLKQSLLEKMFI